jgi:hypothetical protein
VVEVYPRLCTGRVVKSHAADRAAAWDSLRIEAPPDLRELALASEDAFDAAVSAVVLDRGILPTSVDLRTEPVELEGWVWGA